VLEIAEEKRACRLLESTTEADRFLLFRRGFEGPLESGWRIPARVAQRGLANLDANLPARRTGPLGRLPRRATAPRVELLPDEPLPDEPPPDEPPPAESSEPPTAG
jgi:hypothetical protein